MYCYVGSHVCIAIACMYCPNGKLTEEISVIEYLKSLLNPAASLIIAGDSNIDLPNDKSNQAIDFINNTHNLSLHPIITLPTIVTTTSSTIIDNFFCDFNLLSLKSGVFKTDTSDHYLIELSLILNTQINTSIKRNYCFNNRN